MTTRILFSSIYNRLFKRSARIVPTSTEIASVSQSPSASPSISFYPDGNMGNSNANHSVFTIIEECQDNTKNTKKDKICEGSHNEECIEDNAPYNDNIKQCSICLENILSKELCKTECNHTFHQPCIEHAIKYRNNCPMCRIMLTCYYNHENERIPINAREHDAEQAHTIAQQHHHQHHQQNTPREFKGLHYFLKTYGLTWIEKCIYVDWMEYVCSIPILFSIKMALEHICSYHISLHLFYAIVVVIVFAIVNYTKILVCTYLGISYVVLNIIAYILDGLYCLVIATTRSIYGACCNAYSCVFTRIMEIPAMFSRRRMRIRMMMRRSSVIHI